MSRVRSLRSFDGARVPKPMLKLNTAFRSQRERSTSIDLSSLAQHVCKMRNPLNAPDL